MSEKFRTHPRFAAAAPRRSLSFSGALYAWPFHCGAAAYIQQHHQLHPEARIYATSSGAVAGVLLATGVDVEHVGAPAAMASNDLHVGRLGPYFRPSAIMRSLERFTRVLPADAHRRASGRLFITVTRFPSLRLKVVSEFASRAALIEALSATMSIPGHGVRLAFPTTELGLGPCLDGGIRANLLDDNRPGWDTLRIATWDAHSVLRPTPRPTDIAPRHPIPFSMRFFVRSDEARRRWFEHGRRCARHALRREHALVAQRPREARPGRAAA